MKKHVLTTVFLFVLTLGFAQEYKKVNLKNGSEIVGELIDENEEGVKIKTDDGSIWSFQKLEVLSVVAVKPVVSGFYNKINFGVMGGSDVSPSFHIINGYRFNEHWSSGLGLGTESFGWNGYIPVFVEGNYNLLKRSTSTFLSAMAGYEVPMRGLPDNRGGFTFAGKVGFNYFLGRHVGISTELGYRFAHLADQTNWWGWDDFVTIRQINRYEFRFGVIIK